MVAILTNVNVSLAIEGQIIGIVELTKLTSFGSPMSEQLTAGIEHLNTMVAGIDDPNVILSVDGQILRPAELA